MSQSHSGLNFKRARNSLAQAKAFLPLSCLDSRKPTGSQRMMPNLLDNTSRNTAVITKVLSQYELLQSIRTNLSSADIIHLAATCKEHRTCITSSKAVFAHLQSTARCDGRGIVAQARVFGYWDGDPTNAPANSQCLDTNVKPCTSCGAHVCDVGDKLFLEDITDADAPTELPLSFSSTISTTEHGSPSLLRMSKRRASGPSPRICRILQSRAEKPSTCTGITHVERSAKPASP